MCAINDALGQTHCPANSDHFAHLKKVSFCKILMHGRTPFAKAVIATGRDCESASWINIDTESLSICLECLNKLTHGDWGQLELSHVWL